jgi:hypothetical protein
VAAFGHTLEVTDCDFKARAKPVIRAPDTKQRFMHGKRISSAELTVRAASESNVQGGAAVPRLRGMSDQRTRSSAVAPPARLAQGLFLPIPPKR